MLLTGELPKLRQLRAFPRTMSRCTSGGSFRIRDNDEVLPANGHPDGCAPSKRRLYWALLFTPRLDDPDYHFVERVMRLIAKPDPNDGAAYQLIPQRPRSIQPADDLPYSAISST